MSRLFVTASDGSVKPGRPQYLTGSWDRSRKGTDGHSGSSKIRLMNTHWLRSDAIQAAIRHRFEVQPFHRLGGNERPGF